MRREASCPPSHARAPTPRCGCRHVVRIVRRAQICCRDVERERDFLIDEHTTVTSDPDVIIKDEAISMVIEVMGGTTLARDVTLAALAAGKHVVSANKALLAEHMAEIEAALVAAPAVRLGFEAAVAGGIPVIRSLQSSFGCDDITRVAGILNGTTNFMLSAMHKDGVSYADILAKAQAAGFAEADPTADVDGLDALAKLCILARLCFGVTVRPADVHTTGIRRVSSEDFEYAALLGSTIKLVGVAQRRAGADGSDAVSAFLSPVVVPVDSTLGAVGGVDNMVLVESANLGQASFRGPGAGRYPTANSVVSDMLAIASERVGGGGAAPGVSVAFPVDPPAGVGLDADAVGRFYIRLVVKDSQGILRVVGELAEKHSFSLYSVLQTPIKTRDRVAFVITTDETRRSRVDAFADDVRSLDWCLEDAFCMPFL